jgi:hypothetical protein
MTRLPALLLLLACSFLAGVQAVPPPRVEQGQPGAAGPASGGAGGGGGASLPAVVDRCACLLHLARHPPVPTMSGICLRICAWLPHTCPLRRHPHLPHPHILLPPARSARDRALLVSLSNGKLVALDVHTGRRLWAFDSGAPLLSSTNRPAAVQAASVDAGNWRRGLAVLMRELSHASHAGPALPASLTPTAPDACRCRRRGGGRLYLSRHRRQPVCLHRHQRPPPHRGTQRPLAGWLGRACSMLGWAWHLAR